MRGLLKKRLNAHLIEMTKYLRYVLNDFFVIALMFFVGGLGYEYSNLLKTLHSGLVWTNWVILIVIFVSIQLGRLATLLKQPDYVFLLPREHEVHQYLEYALNYSLIVAGIIQLLVWFVLLPFIRVTNHASTFNLILYLLLMLISKYGWLQSDLLDGYRLHLIGNFNNTVIIKWCFPFISILLAVFVNPLLGTLISLVLTLWVIMKQKEWKKSSLNWLSLINREKQRMHDVYQFFNLFTDVPRMNPHPKRRKYLDFILKRIKPIPKNIYLYLYSRGIFRDKEFSALYLRLTIIGMLLLFFIKNTFISLALSVIFIYIIGFQLIPFYFHFDDNVFIHIYPVSASKQLNSFEEIIFILLLISSFLFWIMSFIAIQSFMNLFLMIIFNLIEVYIFKRLYILKKIKQKLRIN